MPESGSQSSLQVNGFIPYRKTVFYGNHFSLMRLFRQCLCSQTLVQQMGYNDLYNILNHFHTTNILQYISSERWFPGHNSLQLNWLYEAPILPDSLPFTSASALLSRVSSLPRTGRSWSCRCCQPSSPSPRPLCRPSLFWMPHADAATTTTSWSASLAEKW